MVSDEIIKLEKLAKISMNKGTIQLLEERIAQLEAENKCLLEEIEE